MDTFMHYLLWTTVALMALALFAAIMSARPKK